GGRPSCRRPTGGWWAPARDAAARPGGADRGFGRAAVRSRRRPPEGSPRGRQVRQLDELVASVAGDEPAPARGQLLGPPVAEQRPLLPAAGHEEAGGGEVPQSRQDRVEDGATGA